MDTVPEAPFADRDAVTDPDRDSRSAILALRDEVGKVIVGQEGTVSGLVAAILVRGHVLLEGVPGVAKTLLVKTVAAALDLEFKRVQFTPDLMPSDLVGQVIFDRVGATFSFRPGPVFTNLLLADEINRTPPKTQAALLESMEERQVSVEGDARPLPEPFVVVATQNPVEYEGTYPLPEAQLDRFLFKLHVGYPTFQQEQEVLARHDRGLDPHDIVGAGVRAVAGPAVLETARRQVAEVRVEPPVQGYIVALVRATTGVAVGHPRCVAARCGEPVARGQGVGLDGGPELRDPRRGQGDRQAHAAPPRARAARARAGGDHGRRRARRRPRHRPGPSLTDGPQPEPGAATIQCPSPPAASVSSSSSPPRWCSCSLPAGTRCSLVNAVLLSVAVTDWVLATSPATIGVHRLFPDVVTLRSRSRLAWQVENPTSRRQRVGIADELAPSLRAGTRRTELVVPAGGAVVVRTAIRPVRRGRFDITDLTVRTYGPLGLVGRQRTRREPVRLRVYPVFASRAEAELRVTKARILEVGLRSAQGRGGGTEFEQLREWTPDDEFRRVDWAATARTNKPIVRTYRAERNQTVVVLLDNGRVMAGQVAGVPRVEHAMDAAMAITTVATRLGDRCGLVAFDTAVRAVVPPARHRNQLGRVIEAVYDLEPELAESDYRGAFTETLARFRRRSLLVILTELVEAAAQRVPDPGAADDRPLPCRADRLGS